MTALVAQLAILFRHKDFLNMAIGICIGYADRFADDARDNEAFRHFFCPYGVVSTCEARRSSHEIRAI